MRRILISVTGLVCIVLFDVHAVIASLLMLGMVPFMRIFVILGIVLMCLLLLHAVFSLPFFIVRSLKSKEHYFRLNAEAVLQAVTGILFVVFLFYHPYYTSHKPALWNLGIIVISLAGAGLHLFLGLPRGMISLGLVREEADMKKARFIAFLLTAIPVLLAVYAYISYSPHYYAGG